MIFKNEETYKNDKGIYQIKNLNNNKVYIGQTNENFQRRFWHHQWCLSTGVHSNRMLQNSWNKHGENAFEFSVIHVLQDDEDLNELEIKYISGSGSTNMKYGYNMQDGGQPKRLCDFTTAESRKKVGEKNRQHMLGRKLSEKTRAKMRASSRHKGPGPEGRKIISDYMSNRIVSEETKEKLRIRNTGSNSPVTHLTERDVAEIKTMLIDGALIKNIAKEYGVSFGAISAISNRRTWNHVDVDGWENYKPRKKNKQKD